MIRKYYVITDSKTKKHITTMLKQDFKNSFYEKIVKKLQTKEYKIQVM